MVFAIERSDPVQDTLNLHKVDFETEYSYNMWIHYAVTYKFETNQTPLLEVYLDGKVRPDSEKSTSSVPAYSDANTGSLDLSRQHTGTNAGDDANMMLDELIIWQEMLSCEDVIHLYEGY